MLNRGDIINGLILLFILLLPFASFSASFDPKVKYRTINTEHFSIHYPEDVEDVAEKVAIIAEEVHNTLSPKFNWTPWGRTQVVLMDSSDQANGMASVIPYNWLYILISAPAADTALANYDDWLRLLIMHEYTHILHLDKYGGFWRPLRIIFGKIVVPNGITPAWMKEGLATYEETARTMTGRGRSSFAEMMLRTAILNDRFLHIDEADGYQWKWPSGYARYIYGVKFLEYLADKYGEEKLYEFVSRTSRSPLAPAINHQARNIFSNIEYETVKIHTRYRKQKKTGAPRSKSFYDLWREWQEDLRKKYGKEKANLEKEGLTHFEELLKSKQTLSAPAVSPDGKKIVFAEATPFGPPAIKIANIDGSGEKRLVKDAFSGQISFAPDGSSFVYSKASRYKRYYFFDDLYRYDFETKKVERLTSGKRARDPDFSRYGRDIICVTQERGTSRLELYDIGEKKLTPINIPAPQFTEYSNPKFSPDDKMIAVSAAIPGSTWDIFIYDRNGKLVVRVTDDLAVDRDPVWSPDGKWLYFVSDRTGISNIYRYSLKTKKTERVTNVLTGVFKPAITPDGKALIVQYYNGEGYDIRRMDLPAAKSSLGFCHPCESRDLSLRAGSRQASEEEGSFEYKSKKYSPFGKELLLPRFITPYIEVLDDALLLSFATGGADPLKRHNWLGGVTYRTDSERIGYFFNYWYSRFRPILNMGVFDYSVDFGTFRYATGTRSFHLYEKRLRGYVGVSYPAGNNVFTLQYFYEDRQPTHVALTPAEKNYFNFGAFAGFSAYYTFGDSKMYQASISRMGGRMIRMNFHITNSIFGSSQKNEQYIYAGDWREYIQLWGRHVLALRAAGGMTWGDELRQGTFTMGGSLGEGLLAGSASLYYLALRGLPQATLSATRALLLSGEYRLPLVSVQRGIGTMPLFVNDLHLAVFADYGNAWNANQSPGKYFFGEFFLGTGLELRGDFVVGYGLPITGRVGYGIIVVNRDRIGGLMDPILNNPLKDGILILQLGTSF